MMQLVRVSYLLATVEDIFGEHESVEELERFVQVIERRDLQATKQLPQSLRVFYAPVYNTTNQISYIVLRRHGCDINAFMKRVSYLFEARWQGARQTPRLEEYLSNIQAAMTGPILLPAYFFLSQNIEEQAIQQLQSESNIINLSSKIVHLSADLQRCRNLLRDAWRRLNRELLTTQQKQQQTAFSRYFMNVALNIARVSQCMYDYEDGAGVLELESMNCVYSLIVEPIQTA
ncbi:(-)-alpha-terpineol synthase [Nymphaea thermarum]|nr:(-)-alpha-terpineol synthase [Nymphaea thermarum]